MTQEEIQKAQEQLSALEQQINDLKDKIFGHVQKRPDVMKILVLGGILYAIKKPVYIIGSYLLYSWLKGRAATAEV